jgi:hypothetical protein
MPKTYCPHCGHPNSYDIDKPKFCKKCSNSMTAVVAKPVKKKPKPVEPEDDEDEYYDDEEIEGGAVLESIEPSAIAEVVVSVEKPRRMRVGDIIASQEDTSKFAKIKADARKASSADKRAFMEEWRRKNSAAKPRNK